MLLNLRFLLKKKTLTIFVLIILVFGSVLIIKYSNFNNKQTESESMKKYKYILLYTRQQSFYDQMMEGNSVFLENKCLFANCLVTNDRYYFNDVSEFDAIFFHGADISYMRMPKVRSPKQVYVFSYHDASENHNLCDTNLDDFFNWTWTSKLDSNFYFGYFTILDLGGNVIGPVANMNWTAVLEPTSDELKIKLNSKSRLAAWIVSCCSTFSAREDFVQEVQDELMEYGLSVDIYGYCGTLNCPRMQNELCYQMIESDYYFYFSLEKSLSLDYVTDELLTALNNFAVPIVYGDADYSRYLPPGSYLDGRDLGAKELVKQMIESSNNMTKYYDFFRWTNHYVYQSGISNSICKMCETLNDEKKLSKPSVWKDFREWWNGENFYSCFLSDTFYN